ncbi:hypothetical protein EVAR_85756_1 [Eumeta japonica]|uniref:Uncharacterized protein n=1 Tax=Eumeta variegata TaxID=151549 RepID=A0A4C1ZHL8_EUMVA|nr:hypothetical protein EVAR_85756_1 [Eumeta japonica]
MNSNLENEKSVTAGKMYPIDLAPQKITIVKSVPSSEVKIPHLIPGQPKSSTPGQIISHPGTMGLMRPATQIISSGVSSQTQMIVSGPPLLQGTQIVTQGSQIIGQGSQIISTSQLINTSSQLLSPTTQIISQGTQLTNAGSTGINPNNNITGTTQASVVATVSGSSQAVNAGGQLISGPSGLLSSSVRTLPQNVRVLPPTGHNPRPVLSTVNLSTSSINNINSVVVSKPVVSHVPRGPAAGASLAVPRIARPAAPISTPAPASSTGAALPISSLGISGAWNSGTRGNVRGALVYSARAAVPRALARVPPPVPASATVPAAMPSSASTSNPVSAPAPAHSITLPATTVLTYTVRPNHLDRGEVNRELCRNNHKLVSAESLRCEGTSVIASTVRGVSPRALTPTPAQPVPATPAPRPIPLLQRNYHTTKVVGVAGGTVRTPVGNSAPSQLYYEVPRPPAPHSAPPAPSPRAPSPASTLPTAPAHPPPQPASAIRTLPSYNHQSTNSQTRVDRTGNYTGVRWMPTIRIPLNVNPERFPSISPSFAVHMIISPYSRALNEAIIKTKKTSQHKTIQISKKKEFKGTDAQLTAAAATPPRAPRRALQRELCELCS